MNGEKDRLGDKLKDLDKAKEDKFFAEREKELLEKMRRKAPTEDPDSTEKPGAGS